MLVKTGLDTERGRGGGVMERSIGLENEMIFLEGGYRFQVDFEN